MDPSTDMKDDKLFEEMQKQYCYLFKYVTEKEKALKENNESTKEKFESLSSSLYRLMRAHNLFKEEYDKMKERAEKFEEDDRKKKERMRFIFEGEYKNTSAKNIMGASSDTDVLASPNDVTIEKLTVQMNLIEKQRKQVIIENEKLMKQTETLKYMVDVTTKQRDELKEKLNRLEVKLSTSEPVDAQEFNKFMQITMSEVQKKIKLSESAAKAELDKRAATIKQLERKVSDLQDDLNAAHSKISDLENIKSSVTRELARSTETIEHLQEKVSRLQINLKTAEIKIFNLENIQEPAVDVAALTVALESRGQEIQALQNDLAISMSRNEDVDLLRAQVTAALESRAQEFQALQNDLAISMTRNEDVDLLRAQVESFRIDFEAECAAKQAMVIEKQQLAADLQAAQHRINQLVGPSGIVRRNLRY